jgi:hypothetical protein
MNYFVGQRLVWVPYYNHDNQYVTEVTELRKHGSAKLSNGWLVDDNGDAEGAARQPGGKVVTANFEPPGYVDDCIASI